MMAEIKAERLADRILDEVTYTRAEAAEFCQLVRKRLAAPKLTRSSSCGRSWECGRREGR